MPMDEVQTEEVASQQQTLAVAEGSLQEMTVVHTRWLNKERSLASNERHEFLLDESRD